MVDQPREDETSGGAALPTGTTGVASGGLGTATNLDETQVYARDDLRGVSPIEPEADQPQAASTAATSAEARPAEPRPAVVAAPEEPVRQRVVATPPAPRTAPASAAGRRVPPLAAVAMVVLVAAAALFVGVSLGSKIGAQPPSAGASFATVPSPTAPAPTETDKGHGKGNGNGNGNGNDNGND